VFTFEGRNELDASIMDGRTLAAGAVCGVSHIKNPIELARTVMEHSDHVMLSGAGAEDFRVEPRLRIDAAQLFPHAERWRQLERIRSGDGGALRADDFARRHRGAVALDVRAISRRRRRPAA
jgi:L-asparaginase / beta-aspartyl-peptidase